MPAWSSYSSSNGLSPPARGSRRFQTTGRAIAGPIPARAGEPCSSSGRAGRARAYPRPRGGADAADAGRRSSPGLSPPARGSHAPHLRSRAGLRPIPARAGEPTWRRTWWRRMEAYPRPRGGAVRTVRRTPRHLGLSPPARGSQPVLVGPVDGGGPIPARAGEPL